VIRGVAEALKPEGRFAVQDYYHYVGIGLGPPSAAFQKVIEAVDKSVRLRGGDPEVGKRLATLMFEAGFDVESVQPLVRTARPHEALWQWPTTFFRSYLPTLVEMALITQSDAGDFQRDWQDRTRNPESFFATPPMIEIVARKRCS
jgi:hypothetical protein